MGLQEVGGECVELLLLAEYSTLWQTVVNMVIKF
jgi:hypothetical protein